MASISFRDFTLNQTNITGRRNPVVTVVETRPRYKIDPQTRQRTDILDGFNIDIIAALGKAQTVKVGLECEETIKKISEALKENNKIVSIDFGTPSTLRGKCYAMMNNGQLLSGVSATASEVNIVKVEEQEYDDLSDLIVE